MDDTLLKTLQEARAMNVKMYRELGRIAEKFKWVYGDDRAYEYYEQLTYEVLNVIVSINDEINKLELLD